MAPKTAALKEEFKVRKLRSSSLSTPKKQIAFEENIAPNSEVKVPRAARLTRVKDATVRGVSPVKSPIKKKSSELSSSPLKFSNQSKAGKRNQLELKLYKKTFSITRI